MRRALVLSIIVALLAGLVTDALARDRLSRRIDVFSGIDAPQTWSLAQDARGFVWIGSPAGLARYDGHDLRRWARDVVTTTVIVIRPASDGTLYVVDHGGRLFRIDGERATPVTDERGPIVDARDVLPLAGGGAWIAAGGSLRLVDRDGRWSPPIPSLDDVSFIRAGSDGAIYAASDRSLWRLATDRAPALVGDGHGIADFLVMPDGSLRVVQSDGRVRAIVGGAATDLLVIDARGLQLVLRGTVLWASFDDALAALRPGEPPEVLRRDQGIHTGGPLLIDHEGALWLGTFEGLSVFPEPDTASWTFADGLAKWPRFLAKTDEGIWTGAWWGLGRIDGRSGPAHAEPAYTVRGRPCVDHAGRFWALDTSSIVSRTNGRFVRQSFPDGVSGFPAACTTASDGGLWMTLTDGLVHVPSGGGPPVAVPPPAKIDPGPHGGMWISLEDHRGRLWVARDERVCWADATRSILASSWICPSLPGAVDITTIAETARGTIWAGSWDGGVWRFDEPSRQWSPLPGSARLASRHVDTIRPSRRGGIFLIGQGIVLRVDERPDLPDGWQVLETLGAWNGLPSPNAEDVLEEDDGSLWLSGPAGVVYVPASARDSVHPAPRVELIDVRVDGSRRSMTTDLELPYQTNRIELRFAALSFRDPGRVRYRVRLRAGAPWSEPTTEASFRFVDLPPGAYRAEVSASIDGATWSSVPASFAFHVGRPWYLQPWALALGALILTAAALAAHRVRVAIQLRLERQRVHIAMDLHDEMGSGLGSIGILAALASDNALPEPKRRGAVEGIIEAAEELGESLGDIVWSLRRGSSTLDTLIAHIVERGTRLLPEGTAELRTELPASIPATPLSLAVNRALQLICFEALHNAARHARAHAVTLGLARASRRRWHLWVEDDGIGVPVSSPRNGLGLTSMRRRAADIGATFSIGPGAHTGTRISILFAPGMPDSRSRNSHNRATDDPP